MKTVAFIIGICFVIANIEYTDAGDRQNIETAMENLKKGNEALGKINEFIQKANPGKIFANLGKVLGALGPAMMAVSAILSVAAMFLPKEDSPELKAINAGFEKVNLRLDVITSEIKDLKNIVELSSAKSSYAKIMTSITHCFETLQDAKKEATKQSYEYFIKVYDSSYDLAADNLYDAMTGKLGPFGFNLVSLYKDHVKCNPALVSQFCTMGIQMIVKALAVEGAYYGAFNLTAKAESKKDQWNEKMKVLTDSCEAMINRCEQDWKTTSMQEFRDVYKKELSSSNQDMANRIAQALDNVVPQRSWLVMAYDDASGFGEHTFSSYYESDKIWHENSHTVTVFSTTVEQPITGAEYEALKQQINQQKAKAARINDCRVEEFWLIQKDKYGGNDSRTIVNIIRETFSRGVVYSVRDDKRLGYAATGNTVYESVQEWHCTSQNYRLMIFI